MNTAQALLKAMESTAIGLTWLVLVTLLILGFFLYFSHLHRRLGKDLVLGGVALAAISQLVIPAITDS